MSEVAQDALSIWKEKLEFLLREEALAADPNRRFELQKAIEDARAKIQQLRNDGVARELPERDSRDSTQEPGASTKSLGKSALALVVLGILLAVIGYYWKDLVPNRMKVGNPLWVGRTTDCNEGIVAGNAAHLNNMSRKVTCVSTPIGRLVNQGKHAQTQIYEGYTPSRNAGYITITPGFRGGETRSHGYTLNESHRVKGSTELFVLINCGVFTGEVTSYREHRGCITESIGWTHPGGQGQ